MDDLTAFHCAVRRARADQLAPLPEGVESAPWRPIESLLTRAERRTAARIVDELRRRHLPTFNRFVGEQRVALLIIDLLADMEQPPSWEVLAAALDQHADDQGPWLVATPLANVTPDAAVTVINDRTALVRTRAAREPEGTSSDADEADPSSLMHTLGDYLHPRARWLSGGFLETPVDTRVGATLVTVEEGTEPVALHRARTAARYALATWTLVSPPAGRRPVWPSLGDFVPQPWISANQQRKPFERGPWGRTAAPRSSIAVFSEYRLRTDAASLAWPFTALSKVTDSATAQVLLSATWAAERAARVPSDLQLADRLYYAATAIHALAEPPTHQGSPRPRWRALRDRLDLVGGLLEDGYEIDQIEMAERRVFDARNIAAHGGDAVLVNLGYPPDLIRTFRTNAEATGDELGVGPLNAQLRPVLRMVREALRQVWHQWAEADFEDGFLELLFAAAPSRDRP